MDRQPRLSAEGAATVIADKSGSLDTRSVRQSIESSIDATGTLSRGVLTREPLIALCYR